MGIIKVLCDQGDVEVTWDPADAESTQQAESEFDALSEAGFVFFKIVEGKKPSRIKKFNAKLGIILANPGVKTKEDKEKGTRPKAMSGGPVAQPSQQWI